MTEVYFQRLAAGEYRSTRKWYAARSPRAAERFRLAVGAAVERIAGAGDSLPVLEGDYRWVRVKRFPYLLIFRRRVDGNFLVVAVAHTSRRPGYWRGRH
jgi:plasmid stabilization system protein ParE